MIKNTHNLSDLLDFQNQKKTFDTEVDKVKKVIQEETSIELESKHIFIKNNNLKIKASSSIRFVILLHLNQINQKIKVINKDFILQL